MTTSELVDTLLWQMKAAGVEPAQTEWRFHPRRRWRFDLAWPDRLLAVEVDGGTWNGGRHTTGSGIEADSEKFSEAAAFGWRVMRLTKWMVLSGTGLEMVERALAWPGMLTGKESGMSKVVQAEVVYILTDAGELHAGLRIPNETGIRTFEGDNLDQSAGRTFHLEIPEGLDYDAFCKRCFNGVSRANQPILV